MSASTVSEHTITQRTTMPFVELVALAANFYGDLNSKIADAKTPSDLCTALRTAREVLQKATQVADKGSARQTMLQNRVVLVTKFIGTNLEGFL